jgi:hypothetical protein
MYNLTSPCLFESIINQEKVKKLYMTLYSSDNLASIIVSAEWDYDINDWAIIRDESGTLESQIRIEKSVNEDLIKQPFYGDGFVYVKNTTSSSSSSDNENEGFIKHENNQVLFSHFMNPCVILDADGGCEVERIYYNTYDTPYLWYENQLI